LGDGEGKTNTISFKDTLSLLPTSSASFSSSILKEELDDNDAVGGDPFILVYCSMFCAAIGQDAILLAFFPKQTLLCFFCFFVPSNLKKQALSRYGTNDQAFPAPSTFEAHFNLVPLSFSQ
jgi:hypothetical protein